MSIQSYFHCKACLEAGFTDRIEVGLSDPETITVHCAKCDQDVGNFKLAKPLAMPVCGVCGEATGPEHKH